MCLTTSLLSLLDSNKVDYTAKERDPGTVTAENAEMPWKDAPETGLRTTVVEGEKTGQRWLCAFPAEKQFDGKKLAAIVGEDVRTAGVVEDAVGVPDGVVPPFGSIIGVKSFADGGLIGKNLITFFAGSLADTVTMPYADYERIEKPELVDITS